MIEKINEFRFALFSGAAISIVALAGLIIYKYNFINPYSLLDLFILIPLCVFVCLLIVFQFQKKLRLRKNIIFGAIMIILLSTDLIFWILIFFSTDAFRFAGLPYTVLIPLVLYIGVSGIIFQRNNQFSSDNS